MAPLDPNGTIRLFVDYVTGNLATSQEHTFQIRGSGAVTTDAPLQSAALTFLQGIGAANLSTGWRVIRARLGLAGQAFTQPVPLVAGLASFVGTSGTGLGAAQEALEWTWQGRSLTSPRRVDVSIYGITTALPANFRLPVGGTSPAWVGTSVTAINSGAGSVWVAVDATTTRFYSYVNANYNSYWERRIRTT